MIPPWWLFWDILFAMWLTSHGGPVRATGSIGLGLAATSWALSAGVPLWRDAPFGDASDIGLMTFIATWLLAGLVMR